LPPVPIAEIFAVPFASLFSNTFPATVNKEFAPILTVPALAPPTISMSELIVVLADVPKVKSFKILDPVFRFNKATRSFKVKFEVEEPTKLPVPAIELAVNVFEPIVSSVAGCKPNESKKNCLVLLCWLS
jgi:hypothetical protein